MISYEEARMQNHEKLAEYMKSIRGIETKLEDAKKQASDWRKLETQYTNELNDVKSKARKLSESLFSDGSKSDSLVCYPDK